MDGDGPEVGRPITAPTAAQPGAASAPAPAPGSASNASPQTASDFRTHGRFTPGQIIADRYRIVSLLGRGGMGEVYRADDLRLGQSVALKFLPSSLTNDPERMARFHAEIRVARQVSHRNVCRMYDLGELPPPTGAAAGTRGDQFVSMEHVDGEDLASLLRRIGRLPPDKAVDIARQLCAGLAAAHDAGVIHRDLKPANIMLDGRGSVRIMDFGVAALAADARAASEVAGTPQYMAPEQLAGREVSVRSDLYSLGLVLYEVFTGRRAFEHSKAARTVYELLAERQSAEISRPASVVLDMDPAVDRAIMRCLAREPADRPGSAIAVLAALPGGDPLAAALAAGETPSPELVAASGGAGLLKPAIAWGMAAAAVLLIALSAYIGRGQRLFGIVPLDVPPAVLEFEAKKALAAAGIAAGGADHASGWSVAPYRRRWIAEADLGPGRWDRLREPLPHTAVYWWRRSESPMIPNDRFGSVGSVGITISRPPLESPGDAMVMLTPQGKLISVEIVRRQFSPPSAEPRPPFAWSGLIALTGVQDAPLTPAKPEYFPGQPADERFAWTGEFRSALGDRQPFRIEAGSLRGEPSYFRLIWRNNAAYYFAPVPRNFLVRAAAFGGALVIALVAFGSYALARRNLRAGRGDRAGAGRLAMAIIAFNLAASLLASHELLDPTLDMFFSAAAYALLLGAIAWGIYLALEPFVRRTWPAALVSWSRLASGKWRDPMIARDALVGAVAGGVLTLGPAVLTAIAAWVGLTDGGGAWSNVDTQIIASPRVAVAHVVYEGAKALITGFAAALLVTFARMVFKRPAPTIIAAGAMLTLLYTSGEEFNALTVTLAAFNAATGLFLLGRFGILAFIVATYCSSLHFPAGFPDLSRWHAYAGVIPMVAVAAIAAAAATLASRQGSASERLAPGALT